MYCNHCGAQNPDGATFCNNCGQSVSMQGQAAENSNQPRMKTRNSELMELERMIRYFSQAADDYAEYDRLSTVIDRYAKGKHHALLVWGIIIAVLGVFIFSTTSSQMNNAQKGAIALASLIPGAAMIVGYVFYARNFDRTITRAIEQQNEIAERLLAHYQDYGLCSVGAEYTNPANLSAIRDTIHSGRADTIKEAINILVEDAYRYNMQQIAAQTARNTAAAARGAKASAVFSAANFFLKR